MGEDELWRLDATAQAGMVRSGAVSAIEMVRAALGRAEELAALHCTTVLLPERALRRAADSTGPFVGVPILLKDAGQELVGTPLWMGTTVLREAGYTSTVTTELTARFEALGFVIVGKAAVPELMTGITTEPPIGPPTGNPWDRERTVGGSSGGSAAAVAAGVVALAHGSESTGSLRYPASCCGVLTLKPSAGRIASRLPGDLANPGGSHVDFVLTRSARDLRRVFVSLASLVGRGLVVEDLAPGFLEGYGTVLGRAVPLIIDAHRAAVVGWPHTVSAARAAVGDAARAASAWTDRLDALLLPILDVPPWLNGTSGPDGALGGLFCSLANFSGQPSVAVPTVQNGLPVGVQLQAAVGRDLALLDLLQHIRPVAPRSPHLR